MDTDSQSTVTKTVTEQVTPTGNVTQEQVSTAVKGDSEELLVAKIKQIFWVFISIIMIIIAARMVFLLLGGNNVGIVSFVYSLSYVFVAPFVGIFPSVTYGVSFFDMAGLVALLFYPILGFIITSIINVFSARNTEV